MAEPQVLNCSVLMAELELGAGWLERSISLNYYWQW